jgi:hypothetical protein
MQPDAKDINAAKAAIRLRAIIRFAFVSPGPRPGIPPLLHRSATQVNESTHPFVLRVFPCLEEVEADFAAAPQGTLDTA